MIHDAKFIISTNLKFLVYSKQKTRKEICKNLDIKYTTFCDWINGKTTPKPDQLRMLADYFGISIGDFYIDIERQGLIDTRDRLITYADSIKELSMSFVNEMSDKQIRDLIDNGYRFKHKSLEERAREYDGKLNLDGELDWNVCPQGRECW